jgi:hypothetical protein
MRTSHVAFSLYQLKPGAGEGSLMLMATRFIWGPYSGLGAGICKSECSTKC